MSDKGENDIPGLGKKSLTEHFIFFTKTDMANAYCNVSCFRLEHVHGRLEMTNIVFDHSNEDRTGFNLRTELAGAQEQTSLLKQTMKSME